MLNFSYHGRQDKNKWTPQEGKADLNSHLKI